jgi:hypothetical protein
MNSFLQSIHSIITEIGQMASSFYKGGTNIVSLSMQKNYHILNLMADVIGFFKFFNLIDNNCKPLVQQL